MSKNHCLYRIEDIIEGIYINEVYALWISVSTKENSLINFNKIDEYLAFKFITIHINNYEDPI